MRGLYRNSDDLWVAGICGGIASHFNVDPSIIRVLMALFCLAGWGLLFYAVLWIVLPSKPLGHFAGKRFYRDMDNKAIGGVASGIARYFNWDVRIVRLIFIAPLVISLFFSISWPFFIAGAWFWNFMFQSSLVGTLIFGYILLWIILPASHADAEPTPHEPSAPAPVAQPKEESRHAASSIGQGIAVIFRVFLFFFAGILIFALFVTLIAMLFAGAFLWPLNNYIWTNSWQQYYALGTLLFFIGAPVLGLVIWLMRRAMGVRSGSYLLRGTFVALWLVGVVSLVLLVTSIAGDFRYYDHSAPITIAIASQPKGGKLKVIVSEPSLNPPHAWWSDENSFNWDFSDEMLQLPFVKIKAVPSADAAYHVDLVKFSAGKSREDAMHRASEIHYNASYRDGVLDLGNGFTVDASSKYRLQNIVVEVAIPIGKRISFDKSVADKLNRIQVNLESGQRWSRNEVNINSEPFGWKIDTDYVMTRSGLKEAE